MGASVKPAARRNARQFALQAIYSWQITKENVAKLKSSFYREISMMKKNIIPELSLHQIRMLLIQDL